MNDASITRRLAVAAITLLVMCAATQAQTFTWNNALGGTFSNPFNWTPLGPPSQAGHTAAFTIDGTYAVSLSSPASLGTLALNAGTVTFLGGGQTISLSQSVQASGRQFTLNGGAMHVSDLLRVNNNGTFVVAGGAEVTAFRLALGFGGAGSLILTGNGTRFTSPLGAGGNVIDIGNNVATPGFVSIGPGCTFNSIAGPINVNFNSTISLATGASLVAQTSLNVRRGRIEGSGLVTLGSNMLIENGGAASLSSSLTSASVIQVRQPDSLLQCSGLTILGGDSLLISDGGKVSCSTLTLNSNSTLTINAGWLSFGNIVNNTSAGQINFNGGTLEIGAIGRDVDQTILDPLLGSSRVVGSGKTLINNSARPLVVPITLDGGAYFDQTLNTGSLIAFQSGTLGVTNFPLQVGAGGQLGDSIVLQTDKTLVAKNQAIIDPAASIRLSGGRLNAGSISNSGLLRGDGLVQSNLINNLAGGEIRVNANEQLMLNSPLVTNSGQINLLGGVIDVQGGNVNNTSAGRISGRGTLRVGESSTIENSGTLALSAGFSDVFGPLGNVNAGKTIVSGGAIAMFWGPVSNSGSSEFRISSNSTAVFFGTVAGTSHITGTGTAVFEGGTVAAAIANGGTSFVGPSGQLNATTLHQPRLVVEGRANLVRSQAGPRVSRLNELVLIGAPGAWDGTLDLANNALVIDYSGDSPLGMVADQIQSGYAGGAWNGRGIRSSTAATTASAGIGFAEASALGAPAAFLGEAIDGTTLLLRYTSYGDANLDGTVGLADFNRLASNFGTSGGAVWSMGDFNYDGIVNLADFNRLASNFGLAASEAGVTPQDWAALAAAVPEPAGATLTGAAAAALLLRRRHRCSPQ